MAKIYKKLKIMTNNFGILENHSRSLCSQSSNPKEHQNDAAPE
jgi:hypothetical protein